MPDGRIVVPDLLLEEREHDHGGGAVVLEPSDGVEALGKWRRRRHEGVLERQAHVAGGQVHSVISEGLKGASPQGFKALTRLTHRTSGIAYDRFSSITVVAAGVRRDCPARRGRAWSRQ